MKTVNTEEDAPIGTRVILTYGETHYHGEVIRYAYVDGVVRFDVDVIKSRNGCTVKGVIKPGYLVTDTGERCEVCEVWHIGRSWDGHWLEDDCPCVQTPCGLVREDTASPACDQHPPMAGKTMRQRHRADQCPARAGSTS